MGDAWRARGCHARVRAPPPLLLAQEPPCPPVEVERHLNAFLIPLHPRLALSLALCRLQSGGTMATTRALSFLTVSPLQCFSNLAGCALVICTKRRSFHALFFQVPLMAISPGRRSSSAAAAGYMARPSESGSGPAEWCGGCGQASWCFPTPPSSPTRPQPTGAETCPLFSWRTETWG